MKAAHRNFAACDAETHGSPISIRVRNAVADSAGQTASDGWGSKDLMLKLKGHLRAKFHWEGNRIDASRVIP